MIKTAKLEFFRGEADPGASADKQGMTNFREWLPLYMAQPGEPSVESLVTHLRGAALQFYNSLQAVQLVWEHDDLLERLGDRFDDGSEHVSALRDLGKLRQGTMPIATFNQRFLQLATTAGALQDATIVARYAAAANEQALAVIKREKLYTGHSLGAVMDTVREEVQAAQRFSALVSNVRGSAVPSLRGVSNPPPVADDPMELGNIRMRQTGRGAPPPPPRQQQQQHRHASPRGQQRQRGQADVCRRCGGHGHWAEDCPTSRSASSWQMQKQCHHCDGYGHMAADHSRGRGRQQTPPPLRRPQSPMRNSNPYGELRNYRPRHHQGRGGASN
jgi:hypothetical protein